MDLKDISAHWENLANRYAQDLRSTTKSSTIKQLEINAIANAIKSVNKTDAPLQVLEVGCGNGHNLFGLSALFPQHHLCGIDYTAQMIENALSFEQSNLANKIDFMVGDILALNDNKQLKAGYDIVFTDRCLINLNTPALQQQGFARLCEKLLPGGHLIIIENFEQSYNAQNDLRTAINLPPRTPDSYNLFINQDEFIDFANRQPGLKLVQTHDFGSLHDLMLYVLLPKINGGKVDYEHPLMAAVTELLMAIGPEQQDAFGSFGQNRLLVFRKERVLKKEQQSQ